MINKKTNDKLRPPIQFQLNIPLKITSLQSNSSHWAARFAKNKHQRTIINQYWFSFPPPYTIQLPCSVSLTRFAPRFLDDDNLIMALKNIRDVIADILIPNLPPGRADSSPLITWSYSQQKSCKFYQISISIQELPYD